MKNLKIQIDKSGVKSSIYFSLLLLLVSFYLLYITYCDFQKDVEAFDWKVMHLLIWLPLYSMISWRYLISYWNLKRKFGITDTGEIEIPESKIEGFRVYPENFAIQRENEVYFLNKKLVSNFEAITDKAPLMLPFNSRHPKTLFLKTAHVSMIVLGLIAVISQTFGGSKFDAKYLLPLKQVEVVEITGNLKHEKEFRYNENKKEIPQIFSLGNYNTTFELSSYGTLANEFLKETMGLTISSGTMLRMKIRKEDLKKFEASKMIDDRSTFSERIRYYELKIGEELLFRKKGLVDVSRN